MATFDTLLAVQKLRGIGVPDEQAEAMVEVIRESQQQLVTTDQLRMELYRALLIQTGIQTGIILGGVAALTRL